MQFSDYLGYKWIISNHFRSFFRLFSPPSFALRPFLSSFQTLLDYKVLIDPLLLDFDFLNSSFVNTSIFEVFLCVFIAFLWIMLIRFSNTILKQHFWVSIHVRLQMTISQIFVNFFYKIKKIEFYTILHFFL